LSPQVRLQQHARSRRGLLGSSARIPAKAGDGRPMSACHPDSWCRPSIFPRERAARSRAASVIHTSSAPRKSSRSNSYCVGVTQARHAVRASGQSNTLIQSVLATRKSSAARRGHGPLLLCHPQRDYPWPNILERSRGVGPSRMCHPWCLCPTQL
jgi:hypothetical protein